MTTTTGPVPTVEPVEPWQPGDPLFPRGSYRNYFFNFRPVEHDCVADDCVGGGDAASWPTPRAGQKLTEADDITAATHGRGPFPRSVGV